MNELLITLLAELLRTLLIEGLSQRVREGVRMIKMRRRRRERIRKIFTARRLG